MSLEEYPRYCIVLNIYVNDLFVASTEDNIIDFGYFWIALKKKAEKHIAAIKQRFDLKLLTIPCFRMSQL